MLVLLRCRKLLSISELWALLSYCIFPLIALVLRFFWDGPQIFLSVSLALIWIYVVLQRDQQARLEKQENQLVQSRVAILLSQIQPHFLYNTLTIICGLCDENPKEAKKVTAEFADYLRHNLDALTKTNLIPFKDELQHIKLYLNIEKKRFEEKLRTDYDIQTEDFLIPSLTVQPIVENAVKHGILKKRNGGVISISTREKKECFEIVISDDGIGFDSESPPTDDRTHIGLKNVQERLFAMCKGTILIESTVNKGTIVTMSIPKEKLKK
ncbi:sensor histidine kinase [Amedibacillus sp. YH-ame10]